MRQFGYVQSIPAEAIDSWVSFEEIDDNWMHYSDHLAPSGPVPEPPAAPTHTRSDVDQPRHAVVSVTICLVVSNVIYVNYFNTNLSNFFVFYIMGCLPCDR